MPATDVVGRVEVARVGAEHLGALTEFYRRVWDPGATEASVRAARAAMADANPVQRGEPPPTWLVLQNGRAIAHVTTIPIMVWLHGRELPAHWIKGLWVLPEHRRSSAGFLVLRAAVAAVAPALAVVHEPAAIRLFQALGFEDLGALPNRLRVLRAQSLLTRLDVDALGLAGLPRWVRAALRVARAAAPVVGPLADAANAFAPALATGRLGDLHLEVTPTCDRDEADALWRSAREQMRAGPVRGGIALIDRYAGRAEYVFVTARARAKMSALAVVKRPRDDGDPRLRGVRIATVSDILYLPDAPRAGLAVLRGAERAARTLGADALLCSASAGGIRHLLRRRGFLPLPANLHVLARFPDDEPPPPSRLAEWWFTRGDCGADGVF